MAMQVHTNSCLCKSRYPGHRLAAPLGLTPTDLR
jgi:hypothetical protein